MRQQGLSEHRIGYIRDMSMVLAVASAITLLYSAFGLAVFVTGRHDRRVAGQPFARPPTHVRIMRDND
jgi:hypothetical protein